MKNEIIEFRADKEILKESGTSSGVYHSSFTYQESSFFPVGDADFSSQMN